MKALIAMGANVNVSMDGMTLLQLAIEKYGITEVGTTSVEAVDSTRGFEQPYSLREPPFLNGVVKEEPFPDNMVTLLRSVGATHCSERVFIPEPTNEGGSDAGATNLQPDHNKISQKYKELNDVVKTKRKKYQQTRNSVVACEALDALEQVDVYRMSNGCKILCLDGGGVRGLVQIEMLRQIEQKTGKRIVDLFEWIVGTSTGGIIALALVYGMYIPT